MSNDRYAGPSPIRRADAVAVLVGRHRHQVRSGDDLEPELARDVEVLGPVQRAAHAREQRARRVDEPLLDRAAERGPVEVALAVVLIPGVGVGVEQHERHRAVRGVLGAELAEDDRVIAAEHERHDPRREQRPELLVDLLGRVGARCPA